MDRVGPARLSIQKQTPVNHVVEPEPSGTQPAVGKQRSPIIHHAIHSLLRRLTINRTSHSRTMCHIATRFVRCTPLLLLIALSLPQFRGYKLKKKKAKPIAQDSDPRAADKTRLPCEIYNLSVTICTPSLPLPTNGHLSPESQSAEYKDSKVARTVPRRKYVRMHPACCVHTAVV